jgi:hypothetical protein
VPGIRLVGGLSHPRGPVWGSERQLCLFCQRLLLDMAGGDDMAQ